MATIAELARREAELVGELEMVCEEIAHRHGEIETAEAPTTDVETATAPARKRTK